MQASTDPDDPREANEDALTARIARTMRRQLEKDYPPAATRRDAHPKGTGLFEATFEVTVATLTIPAQVFRTEERNQRSEELSFSPAHARLEHRPIGPVNRARMQVYRTNSDFRHDRSGRAQPMR
jgi:hypothetical protein